MNTADISATLLDACGTDLSVVNAARVSFEKESDWDADEKLSDRDAKLIRYLAQHQHTSPFNHCFASFRVKAPIFVARQLVKHKFLPWNEVSRRYVDSEPEFYIPEVWRKRADNVKQGSSEEPAEVSEGYITDIANMALRDYYFLLDSGVCPEQARMVLPQNTMTEWIWSGTLGAWADMCRLRLDPHAQQETRRVAEKIEERMSRLYPISWQALMEKR
jgi:thymidylate synthase (FAD)